jgi:hypothetical protein
MLEHNTFDTHIATEKKTQLKLVKPGGGGPKIPGIVIENLVKMVVQV